VGEKLINTYICASIKPEMNFDDKAKDWDKDPKKIERANLFAGEIANLLEDKKDLTGLEFGSGTGLVSFELTERFRSITLADSSVGMLDILKQKIERENLSAMKPFLVSGSNSLRSLPSFDVIYTLLTLHHIRDIPDLFSELTGILNPGGYLFIGDLITEDGSFHSGDPEFDGHKGFEPEELMKMLKLIGFRKCTSKIFYIIERENNSIIRNYPLFFLSAQKKP
jgi:ubiquinone/menaquinone biosynthesis C-methylase UbiE